VVIALVKTLYVEALERQPAKLVAAR